MVFYTIFYILSVQVNDIAGGEEQDGPANNYGDFFLYI